MGKTATVIATIIRGKQRNQASRALVVVPLRLLHHWSTTLRNLCPSTSVVILDDHPSTKLQELLSADVTLASYDAVETQFSVLTATRQAFHDAANGLQAIKDKAHELDLRRQTEWNARGTLLRCGTPIQSPSTATRCDAPLWEVQWEYCFLDEAHEISSRDRIGDALQHFEVHNRVCVTAEPIGRAFKEVIPLLRFMRVEYFDEKETFMACFPDVSMEKDESKAAMRHKAARVLGIFLRRFTIRRCRKEHDGINPNGNIVPFTAAVTSFDLPLEQRTEQDAAKCLWNSAWAASLASQMPPQKKATLIHQAVAQAFHPELPNFYPNDLAGFTTAIQVSSNGWRSPRIDAILGFLLDCLKMIDAKASKQTNPSKEKCALAESKIIICAKNEILMVALSQGLAALGIEHIPHTELTMQRTRLQAISEFEEEGKDFRLRHVEPSSRRVLLVTKDDMLNIQGLTHAKYLLIGSPSGYWLTDERAISSVRHLANPGVHVQVFFATDSIDEYLTAHASSQRALVTSLWDLDHVQKFSDMHAMGHLKTFKDIFSWQEGLKPPTALQRFDPGYGASALDRLVEHLAS